MRILNLHSTAFVPTFRDLGHEVLSLGPQAGCDVPLAGPLSAKRLTELLAARGFSPDLVFWCDACQVPWIFGFETLPAVVIGHSVDQYMNPWHVPYSAGFDAVGVAQKEYLRFFQSAPTDRPALWLPLFCDPARCLGPDSPRDIPVSFVGTLEGRVNAARKPFLHAFRTGAPLFLTSGDYGPIYRRSRLVLNQSAAGELNFRIFEAMGCGAALLTEAVGNGLTDLFKPDAELFTYACGNASDAIRVARRALADPRLPELAAAGRDKVLTRHTVQARAKTILALATRLAAQRAPAKRLHALRAVRAEVGKAYAMLAVDETLPLADAERRFFLEQGR